MVVSLWETEPSDGKKPTGRSPQHDQRTPTDRPPARTRRDGGTTFHGYDHLRAVVYHSIKTGTYTRARKKEAEKQITITHHITSNNCVIDWDGAKVIDREDNRCILTSATGCGGNLTAPSGGPVTSPNYPGNYGHNENCEWSITVLEGSIIRLTFDSFHTEKDGDFLTIYDGASDNATVLQRSTF
ncbi:hypothetical protein Bbelb_070160 [Branchiostoma belcheri]|nr:hypothetical protein Bbelb_070160 [Branchiostoma belcheri]